MDNEILIPKLGWSIDDATFVEWHKSNGEYINTGDEIFSVESDKAIQVVESIDSGWLCIDPDVPKEGQILKSGTVIGYLSEKKTNSKVSIKLENSEDADESTKDKIDNLDYKNAIPDEKNKLIASDRVFITPRAKSLAKKLNIESFSEIVGTGKNNRITEKDINLFYKKFNSKTNEIKSKSPNLFNLTINCSELLDCIKTYNESANVKNVRLIDYLIKIIGHAFHSNNQDSERNINQVHLINNANRQESFFIRDPKQKGLVEINEMATKTDVISEISQSTVVLMDSTDYNIQFFNPKIISPSLISIGIGKYLSDVKDDYYTLNVCYLNDLELSIFENIKLITEFTKSPNRLLL
jgi:hypothetical protein|tara:strand:- start:2317 stop:3375 length:1059 start_codon:yes stop_codon:yes gene_type:complete